MPTGAELISAERQRQIDVEGWTPEHDADHSTYELSDAARCYALAARWAGRALPGEPPPPGWPWDDEWFRPGDDPVHCLAKAGALIAAEIDRLQRCV